MKLIIVGPTSIPDYRVIKTPLLIFLKKEIHSIDIKIHPHLSFRKRKFQNTITLDKCGASSPISREAKGDNNRAVEPKNLCTTRDQFRPEKGARRKKKNEVN